MKMECPKHSVFDIISYIGMVSGVFSLGYIIIICSNLFVKVGDGDTSDDLIMIIITALVYIIIIIKLYIMSSKIKANTAQHIFMRLYTVWPLLFVFVPTLGAYTFLYIGPYLFCLIGLIIGLITKIRGYFIINTDRANRYSNSALILSSMGIVTIVINLIHTAMNMN